MTIIFIGASLNTAALGSISHRTLDSYNAEFWFGIDSKNYRTSLGFFCRFTFFCCSDVLSDGGGDGHSSSSSSARWRRSSFHQPLASAGCDLADGVVRPGNFDALHVGRIRVLYQEELQRLESLSCSLSLV